MSIPICVVDAFAEAPFEGNPAAVCVLARPMPETWMQAVAAEMNLSETAFVVRSGEGGWDLRWFTPRVEVSLCGHATLAAAHALWEEGVDPAAGPIRFHTRSGWLECSPMAGAIRMDFPVSPVAACPAPAGLASALGADIRWCGRGGEDLLVEVSHPATLRGLEPDLPALARIAARGVIVTATSDRPGIDFLSRFFAPAVGVPEDPVTGSAHCALGPFWSRRLGKDRLVGWQASRRGGRVGVECAGDRVGLTGCAVTVWRGAWLREPGCAPAGH